MTAFLQSYIERSAEFQCVDSKLLEQVRDACLSQPSDGSQCILIWHRDELQRLAGVSIDAIKLPEVLLQCIRGYVFDLNVAAQIEYVRINRMVWQCIDYKVNFFQRYVYVAPTNNELADEVAFTWPQLYKCIALNRPLVPLTRSAKSKLRKDWQEYFQENKP